MKPTWTPQPGKPRFCKHCGTELKPNLTITGYDPITGEPKQPFQHIPICPEHCRRTWGDW